MQQHMSQTDKSLFAAVLDLKEMNPQSDAQAIAQALGAEVEKVQNVLASGQGAERRQRFTQRRTAKRYARQWSYTMQNSVAVWYDPGQQEYVVQQADEPAGTDWKSILTCEPNKEMEGGYFVNRRLARLRAQEKAVKEGCTMYVLYTPDGMYQVAHKDKNELFDLRERYPLTMYYPNGNGGYEWEVLNTETEAEEHFMEDES